MAPPTTADVVIVGAGHNGLVAACYLARAGLGVVVLEALSRPGGGARTEETVPGYRFDLHSVAHNLINMTGIPEELDLTGAGLRYQEMDPFSVAVHADGRRVRFFRSLEATVDSIAASSPADASAYADFVERADPIVRTVVPAISGEMSWPQLPTRLRSFARVLGQGPVRVAHDLLGPYQSLLRRRLASDLTRGPVAAFAAHAAVGPDLPGGALYAMWQAAYHLFGQWHARGGAGSLTDALVRRLNGLGGEVCCSAPVARIDAPGGRVRSVVTEGGDVVRAGVVVTTVEPRAALLQLLHPPLRGAHARELAATRTGNVVQAVLHVATDRLPLYEGSAAGDWNGLQSYVDSLDDLVAGWSAAENRRLPDPLPLYAFTTSALDETLAPPGHHTVYIACPTAPFRVHGGWEAVSDSFVEQCLATVERRAPGFRSSVQGMALRTPEQMAAQDRWPGAHPMHLDIALDQLGPFRPTRGLARHRTPVAGLYVSGAGTNPTGGIAGSPGRRAARAVLADREKA